MSCETRIASWMPAAREPVDLRHDVGQRAAPVAPPELRDRAERATHVAALGDLHVGVRHAAGEQPRGLRVVEVAGRRRAHPRLPPVGLVHELHDAVQLRGPEDRVDLRNLRADLAAVPLGEAARHDERPRPPALLELRELEDRVDRLLARPVDEGAGVDHEAVGGLRGRRRSGGRPRSSMPSISSESTWFFGQPRVVKWTFMTGRYDPTPPPTGQTRAGRCAMEPSLT